MYIENVQLRSFEAKYFSLNKGKIFLCGINQYVALISMKTGEVEHYLQKKDKNIPVRVITVHDNKVYGGYEDGEIVAWNIDTHE